MLKTISMSEKGQITIPKEIMELLEIQKGDSLAITTKNKKILIQKVTNIEKYDESDFDDLLKYSESSLKKLWDNEKDNVWKKYLK